MVFDRVAVRGEKPLTPATGPRRCECAADRNSQVDAWQLGEGLSWGVCPKAKVALVQLWVPFPFVSGAIQ
jgi:hypothetical protein